jgi:hypothetical protein
MRIAAATFIAITGISTESLATRSKHLFASLTKSLEFLMSVVVLCDDCYPQGPPPAGEIVVLADVMELTVVKISSMRGSTRFFVETTVAAFPSFFEEVFGKITLKF